MLYLQTCIIGFVILLIPLLNRQVGYERDWQLFRAVIVTVMLDLVLETATWLLNGTRFPHGAVWLYIANMLVILLQSVMGYLWLYYTMEKIDARPPEKSPLHLVCAAPLLLNFLLLIINCWTHSLFAISPENVYTRGDIFWVEIVVTFLYPAAATVLALTASAKTDSLAKKRNCRVLAFFLVPPVVAAILQLLFYGTFLFLIGVSVSLLVVFVNIQNERITVDFLTQVNNRASFIAYFERKIHSVRAGHSLYLFMIDVDDFKRVNDTYGHIVGDHVLITVAEQLKRICGGQKCFLARLGGDEFSILLECETDAEARDFQEKIHGALNEFNGDSNLSAPVTLSAGYTVCDETSGSLDRAILQADNMMYGEKSRHHKLTAR